MNDNSTMQETDNPQPPPAQPQSFAARAKAAHELERVLWTRLTAFEDALKPEMAKLTALRHEWYEAKKHAEVLAAMAKEVAP